MLPSEAAPQPRAHGENAGKTPSFPTATANLHQCRPRRVDALRVTGRSRVRFLRRRTRHPSEPPALDATKRARSALRQKKEWSMAEAAADRRWRVVPRTIFAIVVGLLGLWLLMFGAELAALGGSLYYVVAGSALLATCVLLLRASP